MDQKLQFDRENVKYGGFWIRVLARFIDIAIFWLIWIIGILIFFASIDTYSPTNFNFIPFYFPLFYKEGFTQIPLALGAFTIIFMLGYFLYFVLMNSIYGATLGKMATGLLIKKEEDLQPIGFGKSVGRFFAAEFISGLVFQLGFVWSAWDPQKQTWHDKLARTVVVFQKSLREIIPDTRPSLLPMVGHKFGELIFSTGLMKKKQFTLKGNQIKVGRKSEQVHIAIIDPEKLVSRIQYEIFSKKDRYYIRNLSDRGTTKLNSQTLTTEMPLRSGDIISCGNNSAKIVLF